MHFFEADRIIGWLEAGHLRANSVQAWKVLEVALCDRCVLGQRCQQKTDTHLGHSEYRSAHTAHDLLAMAVTNGNSLTQVRIKEGNAAAQFDEVSHTAIADARTDGVLVRYFERILFGEQAFALHKRNAPNLPALE